ncbi:type III secretion system chaperone [Variovorax sp. KK3]|uniref:type III secretion system chaperone n=1 Tax=Variovorax sp. KK3 TaxID=1855728 RepID=UPI00097C1EC2|nr:type III secretion system chaperone [Variovorax sp. KK3]
MNHTETDGLFRSAAYALGAVMTQKDNEYHLAIEDLEVLLSVDRQNDDDAIHCYVNLGRPAADERAAVCEQLLELNIEGDPFLNVAYAFDTHSGRAIFRARLPDPDELDGDYLAFLIERFIEQTSHARGIVGDACSSMPIGNSDHLLKVAALA